MKSLQRAVGSYGKIQSEYESLPRSCFAAAAPILAVLPPLAGGIGVLNPTRAAIVVVAVVALHLVTMNMLYPTMVGKKLRLNPLAVTLALLFWGMDMGRHGTNFGRTRRRRIQDHLRSCGLPAWAGRLAGRVK